MAFATIILFQRKKNDMNKLVSACIKFIEFTEATICLPFPVPEFIVRFYGKCILSVYTNFDITL